MSCVAGTEIRRWRSLHNLCKYAQQKERALCSTHLEVIDKLMREHLKFYLYHLCLALLPLSF